MRRWLGSNGLSTARRFAPGLREHRGRLVGIGALSLVLALLQLLRPWPIQWIFDRALVPVIETELAPRTVIWFGVGAALFIGVLHALLQYSRDLGLADVNHRFTRGLRYRIFSHLTRLSPRYHARHKSGDLLVRLMGDAPMVTTMVVDSSVELATRSLLVVGTLGVMLFLDPLLTVAVLAAAPLILLVVRWISRSIHVAVRKQRRKEGDLADYMHEALAATETIQSLDGADHVVRKFARDNRRTARAGLKAKRLAARLAASVESLLGIALGAALALGSLRVLDGRLTAGELLVFLSYVRSLLKPVRAVSKHAARIAKGTACAERILSVLDADEHPASPEQPMPTPERPQELVFRDVTFAYEGDSLALDGFDASFRRGELAALVGRSGVGKSTAAALAARLYDPDRGAVLLDGVALDRLELSAVRAAVGLSLQRFDFFGESIRENLLVGRPEASDPELWEALEEAGAAAFVEQLPDGLDARLGSQGVGLSGGQLSRLSLARTLLRKSSVLIVDEPFAGLDGAAARHVAQTLKRHAGDRIVIVIAHDFEQLEVYDRIVFMEDGRKRAEGRHADLFGEVVAYRDVVRAFAEQPA